MHQNFWYRTCRIEVYAQFAESEGQFAEFFFGIMCKVGTVCRIRQTGFRQTPIFRIANNLLLSFDLYDTTTLRKRLLEHFWIYFHLRYRTEDIDSWRLI